MIQNIIKKIFLIISGIAFCLVIFGMFFSPVQTHAQSINDINILGVKCFFPGQQGCGDGQNIYDIAIDFGLNLAPFLAVLVVMWGGYKYLFSGLPGDLEDGKKSILSGTIGLGIVLAARGIVAIVRGAVTSGDGGVALNAQFLGGQIDGVSNFLFLVVGALSVLVVMWGGYKYLFSGLPGEQEDGKKSIQNGFIGLVVVLVARPLTTVVKGIFGESENDELKLETESILGFIRNLVSQFLIPLSSVVTVAFFIVGAYYIITARGDDSRVEAGRNAIRNAVIGLVVVLLSTTLVQLIVLFLPID
ncbi:MAG: hypothetical protein ACKO96_43390 [Flammeovirgaceae bacterium]